MRKILKGSIGFFLVLGFMLSACNQNKEATSTIIYTCPMHPEILNEGPGICPICKMDLVPRDAGGSHGSADKSLNSLVKPSNELVISGIKTVKAQSGLRNVDLILKGVINYNSNQWKTVSARVSGRIERLYVKYGYEQVKKGQKIMDIYSPDLLNAQQELLFLKNNSEPELLESAKKKLLFLGLSQQQINQVLRSGIINPTVSVYSPYSGYVAELELNNMPDSSPAAQTGGTRISTNNASGMNGMGSGTNSEAIPTVKSISTGQALQIREGQYVNAGQKLFSLINTDQVWVEFFADAKQLQSFKSGTNIKINAIDVADQEIEIKVSLVQPYYREGVNYSLIKANLPNGSRLWKVGQLISVHKETELNGNWVPKTAVLQMGKKHIVFLNRDSAFVPVYVDVKAMANDWIDVGDSLKADQKIAINAWFLVDTESFIKAERL
ncbi:efflux RND transporter periplasmic adaptor subunit [Daejeonella sp.]|uniref:efflux RND transporter periplasmic adaptor subunit n=1 Tax=Daejeonella sp. TaxID=2805397 RepID=UPI0025BC70F3|nr:efflux RND transporter periplasmic adaptor subunit [Daejeonella sp.]